jgi:hypothetical protein
MHFNFFLFLLAAFEEFSFRSRHYHLSLGAFALCRTFPINDFVSCSFADLMRTKEENLTRKLNLSCSKLSIICRSLILYQTLAVDEDDVLVVIQLIARQLLIVLDGRGEIAIDSRGHSRLDVDVGEALSEDRAVRGATAAVIRRLLALELLPQMREVMTRGCGRCWFESTLLIVHLLVHGGDGVGNGRCHR